MDQRILMFAGPKQSGKTSGMNFATGLELQQHGVIKNFGLDDKCNLVVNSIFTEPDGTKREGEGILDLQRRDEDFFFFASKKIWPVVKPYNFADPVKYSLNEIFGLDLKKMYGTDEEKNEPTHINWKKMGRFLTPKRIKQIKDKGIYHRLMTYRQVMQIWGTEVCRHVDDLCWVNACLNQIGRERPGLAIIGDARFDNEVREARKRGAKVIRLKDSEAELDDHESETELDQMHESYFFDLIIDKSQVTLEEKNQLISEAFAEWGWLNAEVVA